MNDYQYNQKFIIFVYFFGFLELFNWDTRNLELSMESQM